MGSTEEARRGRGEARFNWRVDAELLERMREEARSVGMNPGEWLARLVEEALDA